MKKIITLILALVLCFGLNGCATLDYIFNGTEPKEPELLPLIYEKKIVSEIKLENKGAGFYQATVNGMIKFDYYPQNIALFFNNNIANIEPVNVVYANVIANDNTVSTWYVATFNKATFNFPKLSAGTSQITVCAEDTKGTMYVTSTKLAITTTRDYYGCNIYNEDSGEEETLLNDFGLKNGEIMLDLGRGFGELNNENPKKHQKGEVVQIVNPDAVGYIFTGWKNTRTGYVYLPDSNGKTTFTSQGGALHLMAMWEKNLNASFGPEFPA